MALDQQILQWVDAQQQAMLDRLIQWVGFNTHTLNYSGLTTFSDEIKCDFSVLGGEMMMISVDDFHDVNLQGENISWPIVPMIQIQKRPQAKKQALFVIHMDTVYSVDDLFQDVEWMTTSYPVTQFPGKTDPLTSVKAGKLDVRETGQLLKGPGIADAKGGIMVMLKALEAFEQTDVAQEIGWKILLNTDEEIGSPSSGDILMEAARHADLGFVFEPCLPNGNIVGARKGSGNFTIVVHGVSAHAGRDHDQGRNAIDALAMIIERLSALSYARGGLTVNVGQVHGGMASNVVPDLAVAKFNVRCVNQDDQTFMESKMNEIIEEVSEHKQVKVKLHGHFSAPAKMIDERLEKFLNQMIDVGKDVGLNFHYENTGGVCDGNRLSAAGLPTIDTLGVCGGKLHSHDEYLVPESLAERVKLTTAFLVKWAKGEVG